MPSEISLGVNFSMRKFSSEIRDAGVGTFFELADTNKKNTVNKIFFI